MMHQEASYPDALEKLVSQLHVLGPYKFQFSLEERDRFHARGLTFVVNFETDCVHHDKSGPCKGIFRAPRLFDVPAIYYNEREWEKWLFDRVHDVMIHELREEFVFVDGDETKRPFMPPHRLGTDQYGLPDVWIGN